MSRLASADSEILEARRKRELFLALVAGGDTPERAAERVGINPCFIDAIILMDLANRQFNRAASRRSE